MKLYKLTDQRMQTYGGYQWTIGEWRETSGRGGLCGPGWLHAYNDPTLAIMLNPIHANFSAPRLFEAEGDGTYLDDCGLKCGVTRMKLVKELPLPEVTTHQRVAFAILCALEVCYDPRFVQWANEWLSGANRTAEAAWAVAWAPRAPWAEAAARAAAVVAVAAAEAAWAAAKAVEAAARAAVQGVPLDFPAIARKAMEGAR